MKEFDRVRLKSKPAQVGVIVKSGTRRGKSSHQVSWFGNDPIWHAEDELELIEDGVRNNISGNVTGTVYQAHTINGPIIQGK